MNPLLDRRARLVIGHRGAAAYAPENTLASLRRALQLGATALELDVRRSADGEAMVFHDANLDRTTDLTGPLAARTREELARADAGYRFVAEDGSLPFRGTGIGIPALRDVLVAFPGVPLLIEIKEIEVQDAVAHVLLEGQAADRAVLAGADHRALNAFGSAPFTLGASRRDIARLYFGVGAPDPRCRCYAVPDRYWGLPIPTRRFIQAAHRCESAIHVWTVDDPGVAVELWNRGANGMVTNRPDVILAARRAPSR
jgi:glycerophosphoryl diester phosphodiesterase